MNKIGTYFLPLFLIVFCLSACNRKVAYKKSTVYDFEDDVVEGYLMMPDAESLDGAAMVSSSAATRLGPLEGRFALIASSEDPEEVNGTMLEVLEMCESGETPVIVSQYDDEYLIVLHDTDIRGYMNMLNETEVYDDDIDEIIYNDEGKIILIELMREEAEVDFYFGDDDTLDDDEYPDDDKYPDDIDIDQLIEDLMEDESEDLTEEEKAELRALIEEMVETQTREEAERRKMEEARSESERVSSKMMIAPGASRYAPIEEHFHNIATSNEEEERLNSMQELLEMCSNDQVPVEVFHLDADMLVVDTTIRAYLDIILEEKSYVDEIDEISYDEEGKITSFYLSRY